jgi:lipoprotein-anchoring transpeptidase ErfK/SrfK
MWNGKMAELYLRPYGEHRKNRWIWVLAVVLAVAVTAGLWFALVGHPTGTEEPAEEMAEESAVTDAETPSPAPPAERAPANASRDTQELFARARSLVAEGDRKQAAELLETVIRSTRDENLRNSALRIQGRINIDRFLSKEPMPEKKEYIIQPGDSLDRIARRNKTTVDLIRRINGIEGSLIYPGTRLLLPAEPFVLRVDKSDKTLDLMIGERRLKRYSVGLGRFGKTPLGTFRTVVHQTNPDWTPPGGGIIPFGDPENVLGTRWISIQDDDRPSIKGFGIHGTSERDSIGAETSNGCVRMLNEDVEELFTLIPRGTEVVIQE